MTLRVDVMLDPEAGSRPPAGTSLRVEVRDTSLADAPATILSRAKTLVADDTGPVLGSVELESPERGFATPPTVWVHADVSGNERVSSGDYITMESYPVPSPEHQPRRLRVTVRPVR